jgi:ribosomal silencing factor RsfS
MEFRAVVSQVNAKANGVSMKLEPLGMNGEDTAGWLIAHVGQVLVVELSEPPPSRTPLEDAIFGAER